MLIIDSGSAKTLNKIYYHEEHKRQNVNVRVAREIQFFGELSHKEPPRAVDSVTDDTGQDNYSRPSDNRAPFRKNRF